MTYMRGSWLWSVVDAGVRRAMVLSAEQAGLHIIDQKEQPVWFVLRKEGLDAKSARSGGLPVLPRHAMEPSSARAAPMRKVR